MYRALIAMVVFSLGCSCAGTPRQQAKPRAADDAARPLSAPQPQPLATPATTDDQRGAVLPHAPDRPAWLGAAPLAHSMLAGSSGDTHIGVWVDVPREHATHGGRPAMAVALVIDASGSMSGAKIRHARTAAARLIERLADGDLVTLYSFDNVVRQLAPPTTLGQDSRPYLLRHISSVRAGGTTNLYGAVEAAQIALRAGVGPAHPVRRVLLVSDGLANVGPSHPAAFAELAERGAQEAIQVSAIGVGLDYSEQTLGALALHSEGRMYHLSDPAQLAQILDSELELLGRSVAVGAYVELVPARGVTLEGVEVGRAERVGRRLRIPLGALYAGQEREILVRARVATDAPGQHPLSDLVLAYDTPDGQSSEQQRLSLQYSVTDDALSVEESYDSRVESMLASNRAAERQRHAAELLNRGEAQQAAVELDRAQSELKVAARKAPPRKRAKLRRAEAQLEERKEKAKGARTRAEARDEALSNYDMSLGLQGY